MQRFLKHILLFLLITSCSKIEKPKKPDNLISKDKMVDIIVDINLINAAKGINKRVLEENQINPEAYILEKYNVDSIQFKASNNFYAYDIKAYEAIYKSAKEELEKRKAAWAVEGEALIRKEDSIRDAKRKKINPIKLDKNVLKDFNPENPLKTKDTSLR